MMNTLNRLLTVQLLAVFGIIVGDLAASQVVMTAAAATFAVALVAMFVQMTTALLVGLRQSSIHSSVC